MKRKLALLLILAMVLPLTLSASANKEDDGFHLYTSTGIVSSGIGLGYRAGNFEAGGNISSAALNTGIFFLFAAGHPILGLAVGAGAFGGIDLYARYDFISNERFELSPGISSGVTYCMLGAFDIGVTAGISLHAAIKIDEVTSIFAETGLPLYGFEYTSSCAPDGTDTSVTYSGFAFAEPRFAAIQNFLMTTRLGMEIVF